MLAGIIPLTLTGALAVQMRGDLHFSDVDLGLGWLTYFALSALGSAPGGRLAQRLGTVRSMRVTAVVGGTSLLAIAAARSWPQVVILLAVAGAGASLAQPACNALLVRAGRPERRGLAFGINQSAIPASTLLGGAAVPALALTVGWRWAFAAAAVTVVATVFTLTPPGAPWAAAPPAPHGVNDDRATGSAVPAAGWWLPMVLIAVSGAFGAGAYGALGAFGVSAGVASGLSPAAAGILHAVASLGSIAVRVFAGWLASGRPAGHFTAVAAMQVAGAAGLLLMGAGSPAAFVLGALLAFAVGWGVTGLYNFAISRRYPAHTATATGVIHVGVFSGAGVGPVLFGQLASHGSMSTAWLVMAVFSVVSAALLLTLVHKDRADAQPASARA